MLCSIISSQVCNVIRLRSGGKSKVLDRLITKKYRLTGSSLNTQRTSIIHRNQRKSDVIKESKRN